MSTELFALPTTLPTHPRLMASPDDWVRLRALVDADASAEKLWYALEHRAAALLQLPPVARVMTGRRLLMVSREALDRIAGLSLVARVTGDRRFIVRAETEMQAIIGFADWNPSHFLDTAEMALALSIGLDWLGNDLSPSLREAGAAALVDKALRPSLLNGSSNSWLGSGTNWAQVCHAGLAAAAIVVADREPQLATDIIRRAISLVPAVAPSYAPDGAYAEGPMYWSYGTSFHVVLAAALERLSGTAFDLDTLPGFAASADFIAVTSAPSGQFFCYADCATERRLPMPLFWFAARFDRPDWLAGDLEGLDTALAEYGLDPGAEYGHYRLLALALLWYRPSEATAAPPVPLWIGQGPMPVAVLRDGPLYLAVKGGSPKLSHAHMDVGSFVLEFDGVRFASDPGMQDYESLESAGIDLWNMAQDSPRWQVFRLGPEAHNILRFDTASQRVDASADITSEPRGVAIDLADLYRDQADAVRRSFAVEAGVVTITDTWQAGRPVSVTSQMLTEAEAEIVGGEIHLRRHGKALRLTVLDPAGATLAIDDVSQPAQPHDAPNPGLKRIRVTTASAAGTLRITLTPES